MECRRKELFAKDGTSAVEIEDITIEEHIERKLLYVGQSIAGGSKSLSLNSDDLWKYQNNVEALSEDKIQRIEALKLLQIKHARIKEEIKACTSHEELDGISWDSFNV